MIRTYSQVCILLQYLQKNMGDEADYLPAYKCESFLQVDNITLGVHSQAYPKFAIPQGKRKG